MENIKTIDINTKQRVSAENRSEYESLRSQYLELTNKPSRTDADRELMAQLAAKAKALMENVRLLTYAIRVKTGQEEFMAAQLSKCIDTSIAYASMACTSGETTSTGGADTAYHRFYSPVISYHYYKNTIRFVEKRVMFPGYILVETSDTKKLIAKLDSPLVKERIKWDYSVVSRYDPVDKSLLNPTPLRDEELKWISVLSGEEISKGHRGETDGKIIFTSGPLVGFEDHVIAVNNRRRNLRLKWNLAGEPVEIVCAFDWDQ